MSNPSDNPSKLAFTSQCVPGSVAEQREKERLAEFQRSKAQRQAQEAQDRVQTEALRQEESDAAFVAHQERMRREKAMRTGRSDNLPTGTWRPDSTR